MSAIFEFSEKGLIADKGFYDKVAFFYYNETIFKSIARADVDVAK